jgi:hypothetical protein
MVKGVSPLNSPLIVTLALTGVLRMSISWLRPDMIVAQLVRAKIINIQIVCLRIFLKIFICPPDLIIDET